MKVLMKLTAMIVPVALAIVPMVANAKQKVVAYRCVEGKAFEVQYSDNQAVIVLDTDTVTLTRSGSGSGAQFTDVERRYVLIPQGNNQISLQKDGAVLFERCTVVTASSKPSPTNTTTKPSNTTSQPVQALW